MTEQHLILVVDDQAIVRKLARTVLQMYGYDAVLEADGGQRALDIVSASERPPGLLLVDVNLGQGMNGIELAQVISGRWPSTRIVVMSSNYDRRLEMKSGWRFLEKPFAPAVLIETVGEALADWQAEPPAPPVAAAC